MVQICKRSALFAQMTDDEIKTVLNCLSAREKTVEKDTYILSAGDMVYEVGIVLSGSVWIVKDDVWGNRTIVTKLSEGELFGETISATNPGAIPVSVVAAEQSKLLFLDFKKIITVCSSACVFHTQLIRNMLEILANKNVMLMQKIEHISHRTTREKLLSYLSARAIEAKSRSFSIPLNRQELADYLCVDRSAMSSELCKLRDEHRLAFHKNQFELF